jgi:hypothetical protein
VLSWLFGTKSVQSRLTELESTVNGLKSAFKGIEADWESTYQKLHAARVSINRKLRAAEQIDDDAAGTTISSPVTQPSNGDLELLRRAFPRR